MKVDDLFRVRDKTIFTGALDTNERSIGKTLCALKVDGREIAEIEIDGEVMNGTGDRDLWTRSPVNLDHDALRQHEVWLIAKQ